MWDVTGKYNCISNSCMTIIQDYEKSSSALSNKYTNDYIYVPTNDILKLINSAIYSHHVTIVYTCTTGKINLKSCQKSKIIPVYQKQVSRPRAHMLTTIYISFIIYLFYKLYTISLTSRSSSVTKKYQNEKNKKKAYKNYFD